MVTARYLLVLLLVLFGAALFMVGIDASIANAAPAATAVPSPTATSVIPVPTAYFTKTEWTGDPGDVPDVGLWTFPVYDRFFSTVLSGWNLLNQYRIVNLVVVFGVASLTMIGVKNLIERGFRLKK